MKHIPEFDDPIYKVPYIFHAISLVCSSYTLYVIVQQKLVLRGFVKKVLIFVQVWNFVLQGAFILLYQYFFPNYLFDPRIYAGFSMMWILVNLTMYLIAFVNMLILELFKPLNERITSSRIWLAQRVGLFVYILFHILPMLRVLWDSEVVGNYQMLRLEERLGAGFVMMCILYDNSQAIYLTVLIRRYHQQQRTTNKEMVISKLKRAVWMNAMVAGMDWITILLFWAQIAILQRTIHALVIQEIAGAVVGIHSALIVVSFQNLRNLVFPEPRRQQPIVPLALETRIATTVPSGVFVDAKDEINVLTRI
jgi:hypothetical protein